MDTKIKTKSASFHIDRRQILTRDGKSMIVVIHTGADTGFLTSKLATSIIHARLVQLQACNWQEVYQSSLIKPLVEVKKPDEQVHLSTVHSKLRSTSAAYASEGTVGYVTVTASIFSFKQQASASPIIFERPMRKSHQFLEQAFRSKCDLHKTRSSFRSEFSITDDQLNIFHTVSVMTQYRCYRQKT